VAIKLRYVFCIFLSINFKVSAAEEMNGEMEFKCKLARTEMKNYKVSLRFLCCSVKDL